MSEDDPTATQATPEELVANMVIALRKVDQTDVALLDILSEHIVKMAPAEAARDDAARAIDALAAKRAEEPNDDPADHN